MSAASSLRHPIRVRTPDARACSEGTGLMRVCSATGRGLLRGLSRAQVVGYDNLPRTGPVLLAANHTHLFDGPVLFAVVRRPAVFFVKAEAFVGPVGGLLRHLGQIPVRRGTVERAPLITALDVLAAGGVVGIFPEGTRGAGTVAQVQHGIAYLAVRSGAPVVPVACVGTPAILARRTARRTRVGIVFGPPVHISSTGVASRTAVRSAAEEIRAALSALVDTTGGADV